MTDLDLLACPKCRAPFVQSDKGLACVKCAITFLVRDGILDFRPAEFAARFVTAQAAEGEHHEDAWTKLKIGYLPWVKSISDYRDWLESFYRTGFFAFGFPAAWLRDKCVLEIGCGPFGLLACLPHGAGVAVDPLMPSFVPYMREFWQPSPLRIAALGEELPVRDGAFDAAAAINCLDHTLEPDRILTAVARALKPGGYFFLMNNVKSRPGVVISRIGEKLGIPRLTEVFHPHAFTKRDLIATCAAAGLEVVRHCRMKISEPVEITERYGWKGAIRKRIEDEQALWLLARKPQ
jgi:SAM-dependent methyltransferase